MENAYRSVHQLITRNRFHQSDTPPRIPFVAFHHREGIVLSTVTYNDDGVIRPIFYRLSLAEMVVPYGAPEHPHPRKHAFDS